VGTGEADDVVSGRSHDRQWAVLMSATGQLRGRLRAVSRGRRQRFSRATPLRVTQRSGEGPEAHTQSDSLAIDRATGALHVHGSTEHERFVACRDSSGG
jgi:hypothetical protein